MKKKKTKSERITVRIDIDTLRWIRGLARKHKVSVGGIVRAAMQDVKELVSEQLREKSGND
jgi:hypothetical protein